MRYITLYHGIEEMGRMEQLYTIEQAAKLLQHSPRTVREWLRTRKLIGVKTRREWRTRGEDLNAFIQANLSRGMTEATKD
jgi:excisionase family DNA binding protein